ncbi:basic proline-rich protein-like [Dromaius novaehollandiae]|uniref:basic proline-rich protein-like n=1 Tax=Dromaius novaehollandiae TaxID=8790 RepID=UPI00311FB655
MPRGGAAPSPAAPPPASPGPAVTRGPRPGRPHRAPGARPGGLLSVRQVTRDTIGDDSERALLSPPPPRAAVPPPRRCRDSPAFSRARRPSHLGTATATGGVSRGRSPPPAPGTPAGPRRARPPALRTDAGPAPSLAGPVRPSPPKQRPPQKTAAATPRAAPCSARLTHAAWLRRAAFQTTPLLPRGRRARPGLPARRLPAPTGGPVPKRRRGLPFGSLTRRPPSRRKRRGPSPAAVSAACPAFPRDARLRRLAGPSPRPRERAAPTAFCATPRGGYLRRAPRWLSPPCRDQNPKEAQNSMGKALRDPDAASRHLTPRPRPARRRAFQTDPRTSPARRGRLSQWRGASRPSRPPEAPGRRNRRAPAPPLPAAPEPDGKSSGPTARRAPPRSRKLLRGRPAAYDTCTEWHRDPDAKRSESRLRRAGPRLRRADAAPRPRSGGSRTKKASIMATQKLSSP